jgi:chaperone BCS1
VQELFIRMYRVSDEDSEDEVSTTNSTQPTMGNGSTTHANGDLKHTVNDTEVEGLEDLAKEFAVLIPDDTFTPAEIQNHLMRHKNEPREAVRTAEEWKKGVLAEKEKQRKHTDENDDE